MSHPAPPSLEPLTVLRAFVAHCGTQRKAATALGISQAYLSDLLAGHRAIGARLLGQLGLEQRVVVVRKRVGR